VCWSSGPCPFWQEQEITGIVHYVQDIPRTIRGQLHRRGCASVSLLYFRSASRPTLRRTLLQDAKLPLRSFQLSTTNIFMPVFLLQENPQAIFKALKKSGASDMKGPATLKSLSRWFSIHFLASFFKLKASGGGNNRAWISPFGPLISDPEDTALKRYSWSKQLMGISGV